MTILVDGAMQSAYALPHRRKSYKPHEIRWDDIAKEATGKLFVMPRTDKHGRTTVILRPR